MAAPSNNTDLGEVELTILQLKESVDSVFLITNGIIVCLMQSGFACLEAGATRAKNTTNIILKNIMDIFISGLCYWLCGYALAYGDGNPVFGHSFFAGVGLPPGRLAHWFFQFVFAATAATILSGAVAERCAFKAYIVYSAVISGFLYPVVSHWVWSDAGWLKTMGYVDFAGSGAVHVLGGTCALVGAVFLGPRHNRFKEGDIPGHSTPLVGLGAMILIAGFLSFNGGSQGSMSNPGDAEIIARSVTATVMGGSGGSIVVMVIRKVTGDRKWSFAMTINGALAGMVSVCAGADQMSLWGGFASGLFSGVVYIAFQLLTLRLKVDDPLDAFAVHFGGGLWGLFAASLFADNGLIVTGFSNEASRTLAFRIVGFLVIFAWSAVGSCILFGLLKCTGILRVSLEDELRGLDFSLHNEVAYPPNLEDFDEHPSKKKTDDPSHHVQQFRNLAFVET